MRVIEKTIYQFDELTDAAKEKAREWFRGIADEWGDECIIDDAKRIGAMIGFDVDKIYWRGFSSQGDGACWTGSVTYSTNCATPNRSPISSQMRPSHRSKNIPMEALGRSTSCAPMH